MSQHNRLLRTLLVLGLLVQSFAYAEVGETNKIDMLASKPELNVASLLLFQARPWNNDSLDLLTKKIATYRYAIDSGNLLKSYPNLSDKRLRIVIVYQERPDPVSETKLLEFQSGFAKDQIEFYWVSNKEVGAIVSKPAEQGRLSSSPPAQSPPRLAAVDGDSAIARWKAVAGTETMTLHVDQATIRTAGDLVTMWILVDFKAPPAPIAGQRRFNSQKMQHEYDCKEARARLLYGTWHSGNMAEGDVVATTTEPGKWSPVSPRSAGEIQWKIACRK